MRIISDFHDYYDGVAKSGQDQTLVYMRKPRSIYVDKEEYPFPVMARREWGRYMRNQPMVKSRIVGVAGKIYPMVLCTSDDPWKEPDPGKWINYPAFSVAQVETFVANRCSKKQYKRFSERGKGRWYKKDPATLEIVKQFFEEVAKQQHAHTALFEEPVFVTDWENYGWTIQYNVRLAEYDFVRVLDPYTTFQEISMWLGAQAQPEKPIPAISDKTMAQAKGFDDWSFRKPPGKRKRKKNR